MREYIIEDECVAFAERLGWRVRKYASPQQRGGHDRIHHKNGLTFYAEYKSTGKKASPLQTAEARELMAAGIPSRCFDNIPEAKAFILKMTDLANSMPNPAGELLSLRTFER